MTWARGSESFNSFCGFNTLVQGTWACSHFSTLCCNNAFSIWTKAIYTIQFLLWVQIPSFNAENFVTQNDHKKKQASANSIGHDQREKMDLIGVEDECASVMYRKVQFRREK
jgi:hypothetical protein